MFGGLGKLFKGDEGERTRARYQAQVDAINALEPQMQSLSDDQLRERTVSLQQRAQGGATLNGLLVEAFAVRLVLVCASSTAPAQTPSPWGDPGCAWKFGLSTDTRLVTR